jgi:hypothetical protein
VAGENEASGAEILRNLFVVICFLAAGVGGGFVGFIIGDATCHPSEDEFIPCQGETTGGSIIGFPLGLLAAWLVWRGVRARLARRNTLRSDSS